MGIAAGHTSAGAAFNIWGNAFPADDLPPPGTPVRLGGSWFWMPPADRDRPDHLRCRGQRIALDGQPIDWIYLLAAAERRTEDPVRLSYADGGVRPQWLRVSDFWPETAPRFGESLAVRCRRLIYPRHSQAGMAPAIWTQRIGVAVPDGVVAMTVPDNPAVHLFAVTLMSEGPLVTEVPT